MKEKAYFIHNERKGYQEYFHPGGIREFDEYYEQDYYQGLSVFDSTGRVYDSLELKTGNGTYERHLFNGKLLSRAKYLAGQLEDTLSVFYLNERNCFKTFYNFGLADGKELQYRASGTLSKEMNFIAVPRRPLYGL